MESLLHRPSITASPQSRRRRTFIIIGVLVALFLIIGAIGVFMLSMARGNVGVSDKFIADLQKNDAAAGYALTSDDFRSATSQAQLQSIFGSVSSPLQGSTSIRAQKSEKKDNKEYSAVVYTVKTKNGDKYIRVITQKVGSDWKVVNFRSSNKPLEAVLE